MANEEQVAKLKEGVGAWNAWREREGREVEIDLRSADLRHADFKESNLSNADLNAVDLSHSDLSYSDLSHAILSHASLNEANLHSADFTGADLRRADLREATLWVADLREADLRGAKLVHANLGSANLPDAKLVSTDFSKADLQSADFTGADLREANLSGANLRDANLSVEWLFGANLSGADLRFAKNYILDSNRLEGTYLPYKPRDPWGKLKVHYTGIRAAAHLLALGVFLLPFLMKTLFWSATNAGQAHLLQATLQAEQLALDLENRSKALDARIETGADSLPVDVPRPGALADRATRLRKMVSGVEPCLSGNCREMPVGLLVLGFDKGWSFVLLVGILVLYNVVRGILTFKVSRVRQAEAENRSHMSPAKSDYWMLWLAHKWVVTPLFFGAVASFAINAYIWLVLTTVSVPAG